jgi:hypothetical protein
MGDITGLFIGTLLSYAADPIATLFIAITLLMTVCALCGGALGTYVMMDRGFAPYNPLNLLVSGLLAYCAYFYGPYLVVCLVPVAVFVVLLSAPVGIGALIYWCLH